MAKEQQAGIKIGTWISLVVRTVLFPVFVLLPAGTWQWWDAWVLIGLWLIFFAVLTPLLVIHDPELLAERMKVSPVQEGQKGWDKVIMVLIVIVGISLYIVPGFDVIRYEWSEPLPRWIQIIALVAHVPLFLLLGWVMLANTYLSQVVKIDHHREHTVITGGPYKIVRHPMYTVVIVLFLAFPVALGSRIGLIPASLLAVLLIIRTALEDRTLHAELSGYPEYASVTRYKLLPGIW
ncbi:methyltransferase family protein [Solemya velum gill symbiont]|uniref:methyltransferase family protein n=1 Tax=Solemya velum gill symbiont TaxID=2340 RepID=UPI000997AC78|nr:isoprenylcysteine carboxylmethyltransferase family protein [Solemya velum gill symbiont]OOZ01869.1 hypothetical protein BOW20_03860 [Solemya velum gill symbiont]OOZ04207.1 hypothetical protein BOW21_03870 [Solemya velum gill symbiont]OOZ06450.1 hypothetical protein BOW22_03855 [Solemya velum gill symbiont]OOZ08546.1 hypothetical protein BOW23_03355 [Solemya velum gill symbiont]OOZ10696.1 hypothetical protein BOW24_03360 [Solemya velum gill symbiont]